MNLTRDFLLRLFTTLFVSAGAGIYFITISSAFHHSRWFILLICTFGIILFYLQIILRITFDRLSRRSQLNRENFTPLPNIGSLKVKLLFTIGLPLSGVLGAASGIGLYIFSTENVIFALINAFLESITFYSFCFITALILISILYRKTVNN